MKQVLFTLLLLVVGNAWAERQQIQVTPEQIDNLAIRLAPLAAGGDVPLLYAPARVVLPSNHELLLSTPQPGFVSELSVNVGDTVGKGQVVAKLHSPELVALQQQFLSAGSEQHLASLELNRDRKLWQEGVIAERRWQETQALYSSKAAKADEAKQLLVMAGMSAADIGELTKQRRLNRDLLVRSPMSGVVLERLAVLGERLDLQAPLFRIGDLSELWLEIRVPQEKIQSLAIGNTVNVDDTDVAAKISLIGQSVDHQNQTVLVRAVVHEKSEQLIVGQNVSVLVMLSGRQKSFDVPNTAVVQNAGQSYLFVRDAEGFVATPIEVLGKRDKNLLIGGEFKGDEQVAVHGAMALKAIWLGFGSDE